MDRRRRVVRVREEMLPHYTRTSSSLHLKIEEKHRLRTIDLAGEPIEVTLGNVLVLETIRSFQERQYAGDNLVKRVNLDQPLVIRLHTTAMWFAMPDMPLVISMPPVSQPKPKSDTNEASPFEQGLHAIQHLLAGVMPLLVMCDSRDINGFYHLDHPDMTGAGVFIYDAYEGGIGLAEVAYERAEDLLALANETVQNCQCAVGCPSCIQSGLCRLGNDSLNKAAAKDMLRKLVGSYQVGMSVQRQGLLRQIASEGDPSWIKMSRERAIKRLDEQTFRMGLRNPMSDVAEERPIELAYHKGQRVRHTSYGRGVVLSSRLDGRREMVTVRFVRRGLVREFDPAKGMLHLAK